METANKLTYLSTKFFTENEEEYRMTVTVSLDDDCHNNMCDWSVTADIRQKNKQGTYVEYMGGCCHDEVAKHFPELAKFIPLHCSNHYGAPMCPVANGIYHIIKGGMSIAMKYLRISEQECVKLYKASEDELYFKYLLFNLGIVDRWKRESEELIKELEKLCGKKWVNPYTPEKERFTLTLTDEERLLIEERIKAGYYSAENIEKRREEAHKAEMLKKRAEICERYDKRIRQAEAEKKIMLCASDYAGKVFRLLPSTETNRDSVLKNISNFDLYANSIQKSYGEKVVLSLESLFNLMFSQKDYAFPMQDLAEYKKKSNAFWIKRIDNLLKYYKRNRITLTESSFEYTVLMDEPDRNLDIDNIMQIYNVLSFHKPQTQIIAIIHNPALIYKLSKLDCVNWL